MLGKRASQAALAEHAGVHEFVTDFDVTTGDYDLVIEAAGSADAAVSAIASPRRGGQVVLLGLIGHGATIPLAVDALVNDDLTIRGSFSYTSSAWAKVVALLNSGQLDFRFLVSHRFPFAEWESAISTLRSAEGPRGKVVVCLDPNLNAANL